MTKKVLQKTYHDFKTLLQLGVILTFILFILFIIFAGYFK